MANTNAAFGLLPVRYLNGAPYNGAANMYLIPSSDASDVYIGDPVKVGGTAGAAGTTVNGVDCHGMPTAIVAAAGDTLLGVVVGFLPDQSGLTTLKRTASTNRIALVVDDPNVIFEVQEDAVGATTALVDIGENADIVYAAGNATTGRSGVMLDSSTRVTTTAQLRMLRFVPRADNEPASANAKLEVLINEHQLKSTSGV